MTPSHENSPPDPVRLSPSFSRRSLLAAVAIGAIGAGTLQSAPAVALATLPYKHPFTEQWFVPNEGEWGNRASWRSYPPHAGVDYNIVGGSAGKTIRAIADGYIRGKGVHPNYGNRVYIEHDDGMWSHYAHMQSPSSKSNGDRVTLGTPIGNVGNTGLSHGAHLHLEMATTAGRCHDGNTSINPIAWIDNNSGTPGAPAQGTLYEAGSALGWQAFPVGSPAIQGTRVAAISDSGGRVLYTIRGGNLWEAGSGAGWNNLSPGISGVSEVAAISDMGGRVVYTLRDGQVWEAPTATWNNLYTGISGASDLSVISDSGGRVVYTLRGGQVWEAATATWNNMYTGISGASRLSVISDAGGRVIYTVRNGQLWEAGSATGWNNLYTGISGISDVAAISDSGGRVVYTLRDGQVWEASTATWNNMYTGISGASDLSVISDSGGRVIYTLRG